MGHNLADHEIANVNPENDTLIAAYRNRRGQAVIQERLKELVDTLKPEDDIEAPTPEASGLRALAGPPDRIMGRRCSDDRWR